jgi:outer membrane murein-binding lipoprotein Lpp
MMKRRLLGGVATASLLLAGCTQFTKPATQASAAEVTKILSYLQAGISVLSSVFNIFGASMPKAPEIQSLLTALNNAGSAFGQSLLAGESANSATTAISNIENLFYSAISGLLAGLQSLPNPNATIQNATSTVATVKTWVPTIAALVNSTLGYTSSTFSVKQKVGHPAELFSNLGLLVP